MRLILIISLFFSNSFYSQSDTTAYTVVEDMPEFPGGQAEMFSYILKNLKYPELKKDQPLPRSVVYVQFVIEKDGMITGTSIVKGSGNRDCDKAAFDVISSMPAWKPGKQNGKKCRVKMLLPIRFELK